MSGSMSGRDADAALERVRPSVRLRPMPDRRASPQRLFVPAWRRSFHRLKHWLRAEGPDLLLLLASLLLTSLAVILAFG